jgi:oxalate decarboxylase/phosphoglucose isomerase-like protein (cupin superfamily)
MKHACNISMFYPGTRLSIVIAAKSKVVPVTIGKLRALHWRAMAVTTEWFAMLAVASSCLWFQLKANLANRPHGAK